MKHTLKLVSRGFTGHRGLFSSLFIQALSGRCPRCFVSTEKQTLSCVLRLKLTDKSQMHVRIHKSVHKTCTPQLLYDIFNEQTMLSWQCLGSPKFKYPIVDLLGQCQTDSLLSPSHTHTHSAYTHTHTLTHPSTAPKL